MTPKLSRLLKKKRKEKTEKCEMCRDEVKANAIRKHGKIFHTKACLEAYEAKLERARILESK